jgi:hypothetical protein
MPLVTRLFASSGQAWENKLFERKFLPKTRTVRAISPSFGPIGNKGFVPNRM